MKKREPNNHIFILCLTGFSSVNLLAEPPVTQTYNILIRKEETSVAWFSQKGKWISSNQVIKITKTQLYCHYKILSRHSEVTHLTKREEKNRTYKNGIMIKSSALLK